MMNGFVQRSRMRATVCHDIEVGWWSRIQNAESKKPRRSRGTKSITLRNDGMPCASKVDASQRGCSAASTVDASVGRLRDAIVRVDHSRLPKICALVVSTSASQPHASARRSSSCQTSSPPNT